MTDREPPVGRLRPAETAALLLLGAALFLPGIGANDLWNPDEPRYAEIAREMLLFNDLEHFLVPRLNGELYTQKPPLHFWLIVASAHALGRLDEVAARLPVAVSGMLTLPLIFAIGRRWFDRRSAWLSVLVFGTCVNIMMQARTAQIDMLLVCLVTLAVYFWVRAYLERRPALSWLFFVSCGLATLAKGPVGLLPPLLSIVVFLLVTGQRGELRRLRLPSGLALYLLVVAAWLVPAALHGGEAYWKPILLKQNLERFANPWGHLRPWYYYLQILPANFFPWAFLLPSAIALGWRRLHGRDALGYRFALCWTCVTLVFFSLSPGKRTVYILTMYPAMALLIGVVLQRWDQARGGRRAWLGWPLGVLTVLLVVLTGAAVYVGASPAWIARRPELEALGATWLVLAAGTLGLLACGALAALILALRRRVRASVIALATASALAGTAVVLWLQPPFDAFKSARPLAEIYLARAADDEPYGIYPRLDPPFVFYTRRFATVLRTPDQLRAFAAGPQRVWVFAERNFLEDLDPPPVLVEVARDADPLTGYALLTTPPFPPPRE